MNKINSFRIKCVFLASLCLTMTIACVSSDNLRHSLDTKQSIQRIENSLSEAVLIKGQALKTYSIEERLTHHNIPGLSVAVAYDGEVLWSKGYGMADVAESREMTPETMLLAGSISKPIAALRALQLHDEGRMKLDVNVNQYLTSWQVPDNEYTDVEKVTIRRILNHTAGLTVWGFPGYDKGDDVPSTVEVLEGKGNTDAVTVFRSPGEAWQYSGGGYTIMQLAIADVENMDFATSLKQHVLSPLNMQKSTFENPLPEQYHSIAATGYRENGDEVEGKWPIYPEMAAAGLWTTAEELLLYGIEIQRIMDTQTDGVISYKTATEMLTPGLKNHGLGPVVDDDRFRHSGADEGFRALFVGWRNQPYVAVIMVNSDVGAIISEVIRAIAAEYNLPGYELIEKEVIALSSEALAKFVGIYDSGIDGTFEILQVENGLSIFVRDFEFTAPLLPQSENVFFEKSTGIELTFVMEDGTPTEIQWRGLTATRVD